MSKKTEEDAQPEALATFAAAARNKGIKPPGQGISATAETAGKSANPRAAAKTFLADMLANGPIAKADIEDAAKANCISTATLRRSGTASSTPMLRLVSTSRTTSRPGGRGGAGTRPHRGWARATIRHTIAASQPRAPSPQSRPPCPSADH